MLPNQLDNQLSPNFSETTSENLEIGSFRDRNGRVFYHRGEVFRSLSEKALADWRTLCATSFFPEFVRKSRIIKTELVSDPKQVPYRHGDLQWAGTLRHKRIPFISYPYEWTFGMLKDAALLHLELLLAALDEGMILKDSSAFNVQWIGASPVFIDIPSFEQLSPGEPWVGYRQFCQMFLYPLLLQAYKGISFQTLLRGSIDGIDSADCAKILSGFSRFRPGVFKHVYLQMKLEQSFAATNRNVKSDLKTVGFHKELIKANVKSLARLISKLELTQKKSTWSNYTENNSYQGQEQSEKQAFVRDKVRESRRSLVWDLGCNTGTFSRIAAENADSVVAMDFDSLAVERFYRALHSEENRSILPLTINLANPSPNLGWRGLERKSLPERGKPNLVLCLALIHHLVISANIPLDELIAWLASLGGDLIIEFVTKDDPMVQTLLRNKDDIYSDYNVQSFEQCLGSHFSIRDRKELSGKTRILYYAKL